MYALFAEFLGERLETVLGHLSRHHGHDIAPLLRNAWVDQITSFRAR